MPGWGGGGGGGAPPSRAAGSRGGRRAVSGGPKGLTCIGGTGRYPWAYGSPIGGGAAIRGGCGGGTAAPLSGPDAAA